MSNYYRKRLQGFIGINESVEKITAPVFGKKGNIHARLYNNWQDIVGDYLADKMQPNKITFTQGQKANGQLYIDVYGAWALEISHMEQEIIEKFAVYFGYHVIDKIKINQKPYSYNEQNKAEEAINLKKKVASRSYHNKINNEILDVVEDDDLKMALQKLGQSVNN